MTPEHRLQNAIRVALSQMFASCIIFRANVGQAWTGNEIQRINGKIVIEDPRPFQTGLPEGFADLFGMIPVQITPEMVGQTVAIVVAIEVKSAKGRVTDKQQNFITRVKLAGGRAGVARSVEDACRIIKGD